MPNDQELNALKAEVKELTARVQQLERTVRGLAEKTKPAILRKTVAPTPLKGR